MEHVRHRADLTYILDILGGETSIGHSFTGGGDFPDVETVIPALAERYTLALISNTIRSHFEKTFPCELARLFQATLFRCSR